MMKSSLLALVVCTVLAACAQQPIAPDAGGASPAQAKGAAKPQAKTAAKPAPPKLQLPTHELTEQLMMKLMLAEVAVQRGQPQVAVPAYLDLARETRDPRVAQRATEIAWNARFIDSAIEAAGIWLQADPQSQQARQVLAALLVNQAQLANALPHLEKWLRADEARVGQSFLQITSLLARHKDRKAVLELMQGLASSYREVPEARFAVAQAAWNAENAELALNEVRAALRLRPDWEIAALFQAQILQRRSAAEALTYLAGYLKQHPQAKDARLSYARMLVADKQLPEARTQFEVLLAEFPDNAEVTMAVALLALQLNDYDAAETQLKRALEKNYKDPDAVRLYLGQVNEERKRYDEALKWYGAVGAGEQHINAQARYAGILAKQGRLADARKHLQQVSPRNTQQRVQLTQAEAQLLREATAYQDAFDLLGRALEKLPDSHELLYDHAMAAEKVNRLDVLEANLRKLITLRPDHAHAHNALGYTFADRNERLDEARQLIETALKLAPEDPFIMDSMGWVLYRQGQIAQALDYLKRAHALRPDPEIAAHLGELLWVSGQRDEARKLWSSVQKEHPNNEVLQNTVNRFLRTDHPAAR
ncbi:MAG: tetratricopeptide repeat protein [Betaproteobacteria bacterium]